MTGALALAAACTLGQGRDLYEHGRYRAARACFQQALAADDREEPTLAEAEARRWLGRTLFKAGRLAEATRELEEALGQFEALSDPLGAARVKSHLGAVGSERNTPEQTRELYQEARRAFQELGPAAREDLAQVEYNLVMLGGPDAESLMEAGLADARERGDRRFEARYVMLQGDDATTAGDFVRAAELFDRAQAAFEAVDSLDDRGRLHTSRSRLRTAHGDPEGALREAQAALRLQEESGEAIGAAQSLSFMGTAATRLGRPRAALGYFDRALRWARRTDNAAVVRRLSVRVAETHLSLREPRPALRLLQDALRPPEDAGLAPVANELLARALLALGRAPDAEVPATRAVELAGSEPVRQIMALHTRALVRQRLGRVADALADAQAAMDLVDRTKQIRSDSLRQQFRQRHQAVFGTAVELLHGLGRYGEAIETAERGRARAFLELLADRAAAPAAAEPLGALGIAGLADSLRSHVLAFWVGPEATFAWVVAPDGVRGGARIAVRAARLAELVRGSASGVDAWRRGGSPERPEWRELHRLLIDPVARWLPREEGSRLTVVPHGPLFRLSFAGLRDRRGVYLVERHTLHSVPALGALRAAGARDPVAPRYLLVADPAPLPPATGGSAWPALPGARREVQAIARLLPGAEVTTLTGSAADEASVRAGLAHHAVVHLAVHGDVRDDAPLDSFVALGRGEGPGAPDGRLTSAEAYALRLQADLVFLSACRSGRGPVTGDGVLGLTRAFLSAGASSLVTTLWDVPDLAAAELVPAFYRSFLRGDDKSAALRVAQLRLMRALRAGRLKARVGERAVTLPEDPALWAAYVLVGHPDRLHPISKDGPGGDGRPGRERGGALPPRSDRRQGPIT